VEVPPHLRLGLNCRAYIEFIDFELIKVGFMKNCTSIRSKYPPGLSWIAEQYGDRLTGYDLAEATKMWLRLNNAEGRSVYEVLMERGWEGVGEAEVFLSHVQAEHPKETQNAMVRISDRAGPARRGTKHEGSKVWVDYFCLRQLRNDFKPEQIEELICLMGRGCTCSDRQTDRQNLDTPTVGASTALPSMGHKDQHCLPARPTHFLATTQRRRHRPEAIRVLVTQV